MQDLDSAVGRLDNILMSVYVVVALLVIAAALVSAVWSAFFPSGALHIIYGDFPGNPGYHLSHRSWDINSRLTMLISG